MLNQASEGLLSKYLQKKRLIEVMYRIYQVKKKKIDLLDFGCGDCFLLKYLDNTKYNYTGYDINNVLLEEIRNRDKKINLTNKIDNGKYDVIVLSAVIEHLSDPMKTVSKLKLNLRDSNSIIIITTPNKYFDFIHEIGAKLGFFSKEAAEEHHIMFSKNDLFNFAKKINFEVIFFKYFLFYANQILVIKPKIY